MSPTGVFMYIAGYINNPVGLTIDPWEKWETVSTGLEETGAGEYQYKAKNFDELYDCPILIGNQDVLEFEAEGKPHYVAIEDPGTSDRSRIISDLKTIVETATGLIGEVPYNKYEFIIMSGWGGGLEHCNSMAVYSDISDYPGAPLSISCTIKLGYMDKFFQPE